MQRIGPWFVLFILSIWGTSCVPIVDEHIAIQNSLEASNINNYVQSIGGHSQPNFLFISIDDLNMSPGIYGGQAKTPNIDTLANQGTLFTDAHVNGVRCNPSRTSLVTGLRPTSTGIFRNAQSNHWRASLADGGYPDIVTLPQFFRASGYYAAASGKLYHGQELQAAEGWDAYYGNPKFIQPRNKPMSGYDPKRFANWDWGAIESAQMLGGSDNYHAEADLPDYMITEQALTMIKNLPQEQPFFLSVGYSLPHAPLYVPQRMIDLYPVSQVQLPEILKDDVADLPQPGVNLTTVEDRTSQQYFQKKQVWREMIAHYLAAVSYVDEQIGIVLGAMEEKELLENTIIILWSDHGFHMGEKERLFKGTLWQETTQVPFIVVAPGLTKPGSVVDSTVGAVDIFPSMVELAGLEMPTDYPRDGRSFVRLLEDPNAAWPWSVATSISHETAAIRNGDWTYIRYDIGSEQPRDVELYHPQDDPYEWYNLLFDPNNPRRPSQDALDELDNMLQGQIMPNVAPIAQDKEITLISSERIPIRLTADDANKNAIQFTLMELPSSGRLYLTKKGSILAEAAVPLNSPHLNQVTLFYEPFSDGLADSFTFSASDGAADTVAQITIKKNFE